MFRGFVEGEPGSWAAMWISPRGVRGVAATGGQRYLVSAGPGVGDRVSHAVGVDADLLAEIAGGRAGAGRVCAGETDQARETIRSPRPSPPVATPGRATDRLVCDLAIDCDYEYCAVSSGGDVARATDYILGLIGAASAVYEHDLNVTLRVSYLNIWVTPDDPYSASDIYDALYEFRDWWSANRAGVPRTLAHLVSGRDYGRYGGVARSWSLCEADRGYAVSRIDGTAAIPTSMAVRDLSLLSHEIGHNFGSPHTHSCFWQDFGYAPPGSLLDSCSTAEGDCYTGPTGIIPAGGGTIMSYCPAQTLEFHPACRTMIRERAEASCMVADAVQPPSHLAARVEPGSVTLIWNPSPSADVIRYDIYRSPWYADPAPALIGSSAADSFVDGRLRETSYYRVRAIRLSDRSELSAALRVEPNPVLPAYAFLTESDRVIRLQSGKPLWCARLQPADSAFTLDQVDVATIVLRHGSTAIGPTVGKGPAGVDANRDGLAEFEACFSKNDLRILFAELPAGAKTASVHLDGGLVTGRPIRASLDVGVSGAGPSLRASVAPNPWKSDAALTIHLARAGPVWVGLYNSLGRLVCTLLDEQGVPAGYRDVRIPARDGRGKPLPSGVYFYRVSTAEGTIGGKLILLR
jgi:hypothetical protein